MDLSRLNVMLSEFNTTHSMMTPARSSAHSRACDPGRISQARASRSSVYETIEEEKTTTSLPPRTLLFKKGTTACPPISIVDPGTTSIGSLPPEPLMSDDERGIMALRRYYALRDEAQDTVTESKRQWLDTPFSVFALQSFHPPQHLSGMQALLDHSLQNYGPLPSELRPRRMRSRTESRPSPYPKGQARAAITKIVTTPSPQAQRTPVPVLRQISVDRNVNFISTAPSLETLKPFSPLVVEPKRENVFGSAPAARSPAAPAARRTALGSTKRHTGKSSMHQKENAVGQGPIMSSAENLRFNRPRLRGRPTPASQQRIIRV